jgi:nondiscriminating aspartyl-tRNA synthetase
MTRTLIKDTNEFVGQKITVSGWVNSKRSYGKLVFIDLRDRSGIIQIVGNEILANVREESVVKITGNIRNRAEKYFNEKIITGKIEMEAESIEVLSSSAELPFDIHQPELNVTLPVLLDNRSLSFRNQKIAEVFKVQETIVKTFREFLTKEDFTEIQIPTIVATATEGGSELFPIEYFDKKAYLAQSPQFYKQIMVSIFERVFTLAHAYRAEPSVTTRHITEYVGLDAEMGFIESWEDVMNTADGVVKAIFKAVKENHQNVLADYKIDIPQTVENTPRVKLKEALQIIFDRTGRDIRNEPDLDPEGEREICRYALEKFNSDIIFITHFPTKKRPAYAYPDPENPEETLSFDLLGKGVEWITGGQRIHNYEQLKQSFQSRGIDTSSFEKPYFEAFKYGMPPEGGFCIGLERITQNILGLENIRQASLFPRDMERVDTRLC